MRLPILEIIATALPDTMSATERVDVARAVLTRLRDSDYDPDVLTARLEMCDAARGEHARRADAAVAAHDGVLAAGAALSDERNRALARLEVHSGSTRLLAAALNGDPLDVEAARATVEAAEAADAEA